MLKSKGEKQFKKFADNCMNKCINRKLNLFNMFLGLKSAQLIARWLIADKIDITHLLLAQNNIGDEGLETMASVLMMKKTIVVVDFSQNGLTPKSASSIAGILSRSESIVDLNIGSIQGSNRNRLCKDGALALAYGFSLNLCVVQILHLRGVQLGNEEVEMFADSLQDYLYLLHIDLSQNRLEGTRGGAAINRILGRRCKDFGGVDLEHLDLANNKLGNGGFAAITHHLITNEDYDTLTLNLSNN